MAAEQEGGASAHEAPDSPNKGPCTEPIGGAWPMPIADPVQIDLPVVDRQAEVVPVARATIDLYVPLAMGVAWQGKAEFTFAVGAAHGDGLAPGGHQGNQGRLGGLAIAKTALQQNQVVVVEGFQVGLDGVGLGRARCCNHRCGVDHCYWLAGSQTVRTIVL